MNKNITQILITDGRQKFSDHTLEFEKKIKDLYKDYSYYLFNKTSTEEFIKEKFNKDVLNAFRKLNPYAYKADLARYCILYYYGGWYFDIGITCLNKIEVKENIDFICFRDDHRHSKTSWAVCNGIFYSKPKSPILDYAIDLILQNCAEKWYGRTPLCPTGPALFGEAIAAKNRGQNIIIGDLRRPKIPLTNRDMPFFRKIFKAKFILSKQPTIALVKPAKGGDITSIGIRGSNNYNDFWHSRNVYK